jgi:excisionase family DNA binding protein
MDEKFFLRHFYDKELVEYIHRQVVRHFSNVEDQADATQEAWCAVGIMHDDIEDDECRRKVYSSIRKMYRAHRKERDRFTFTYHDDMKSISNVSAHQGGERVKLWTVMEAAELMRISRKTLAGYCSRHEIPHIRIGARILFREDDLYGWIEGHAIIPNGSKRIEIPIKDKVFIREWHSIGVRVPRHLLTPGPGFPPGPFYYWKMGTGKGLIWKRRKRCQSDSPIHAGIPYALRWRSRMDTADCMSPSASQRMTSDRRPSSADMAPNGDTEGQSFWRNTRSANIAARLSLQR